MHFYAGNADDEAETPYGVVITQRLEETIKGDRTYYGSVEVRIVHDIDDSDHAAHSKRVSDTQRALANLQCPSRDPDNGVDLLGLTPLTMRPLPGRQVFINLIPLEIGMQDWHPAPETSPEHRLERAFAEYLTERTGGVVG